MATHQPDGHLPIGDPAHNQLPAEVPVAADPGGAHIKGFSAEGGGLPHVPADGPLPMAAGDGVPGGIKQPERDGEVRPVGRAEPGPYNPNDHTSGADH